MTIEPEASASALKKRKPSKRVTNIAAENERRQAIHARLNLLLDNPTRDEHMEILISLLIGWELEARLRRLVDAK